MIQATVSRNVVSDRGREEYVPVRIRFGEEVQGYIADPILGKSSLITTLVQADGYIRIDQYQEGLYQGETVSVRLF
jgi:molybdopterin molybdotransferase